MNKTEKTYPFERRRNRPGLVVIVCCLWLMVRVGVVRAAGCVCVSVRAVVMDSWCLCGSVMACTAVWVLFVCSCVGSVLSPCWPCAAVCAWVVIVWLDVLCAFVFRVCVVLVSCCVGLTVTGNKLSLWCWDVFWCMCGYWVFFGSVFFRAFLDCVLLFYRILLGFVTIDPESLYWIGIKETLCCCLDDVEFGRDWDSFWTYRTNIIIIIKK